MADNGHEYKFNVEMACGGCSGAVKRAWSKLDQAGIKSYDADHDKNEAILVSLPGGPKYRDVLQKVVNTGKKVNGGWRDGVEMPIEVEKVTDEM